MISTRIRSTFALLLVLSWGITSFPSAAFAQNKPKFKRLPPDGIQVPDEISERLGERVESLRKQITGTPDAEQWRPDVEVFLRAVDVALEQNCFFRKSEFSDAEKLLDEAERRLRAARGGTRGLALLGFSESDSDEPQMLVGGYVSRIDDSVQPFGLVIPSGYAGAENPSRLDVWLHGRGDTKTEIPFLTERMNKVGQYAPSDTIVLHPFGRHCNAFKFAGETDVFEAIDHVNGLMSVDSNRVLIRGFSMGGAGCWHLGVHDSTRWFAVNPGAGFVDTIDYQGWSQQTMPFPMTASQKKLLAWYDVLPWASNLRNTHVVAYSGEKDKQKKAADRVFNRSKEIGISWPYVIGAGMGHKIDAFSKQKIETQLSEWASLPSSRPRKRIDFTTYTLRYSRASWLQVTGMREHWTQARVQAEITGESDLRIQTDGVTQFELDFSESGWPKAGSSINLDLNGGSYRVFDSLKQEGFQCRLAWNEKDQEWVQRSGVRRETRKRPGLQGPIDDAFCDRFVFVLPSRPARHGVVQRWIDRETRYAQQRWKQVMRGDVQVVMDRDLTQDQIETCHLICFGDFSSNRYLFSVASALPLKWTRDTLEFNGKDYDPVNHAPVMCLPNPKNPDRYLVINSGMTFREFSNVSNSRQIAMLPDWAILDVRQNDDSIFAGRIVDQGFFNEQWGIEQRGIER